jgi:hypothetical protein
MTNNVRKNFGMKMWLALIGFCCMGLSAMAGPLIIFNDNGGWCWYQDERVIVQNNKLIIGSVGNSAGTGGSARNGDIEVTTYDLLTFSLNRFLLRDALNSDDHAAPAFMVRPDGKILAMYATHGGDSYARYRITTNAGDTSSWQAEQSYTAAAGVTYSNVYRLSGTGITYDFYRGENYNPNVLVSSNDGSSWGYGGRLIRTGTGSTRPYVKYVSNNTDKIWFTYTDGHPRDVADNNIYVAYLQGTNIYNAYGVDIGNLSSSEGIAPSAGTMVYDAPADGSQRGWTSDIQLDSNGYPVLGYTTRVNNDDHRYRYARFNGTTWTDYQIAYAGQCLYTAENDYTGLVTLDPQNPNVLYISTNAHPVTGAALISSTDGLRHWEIFRGTTADGGATWTWEYITKNSTLDNIRPIVPIWDNPQTILLWMRGSYSTYTSYNMQIVGMFDPEPIPSNEPEITDQPDPGAAPIGGTATFKVSVTGLAPLTYTWYKEAVSGSDTQVGTNSKVLTLTNVQSTDVGQYYCVVSNSAGSATSSSASLMIANLLAYWPLDGNYNDVTGNGYNATAVGSPTFTSGHLGQAISFNGSSYLNCQNSGDLMLKDGGTVSAWVKTSALNTAWASVVSKGQFGWRLSRNNDANSISFRFNSPSYEYQADGDIPVVDGTWHHLAATYDVQSIKLYVDGQLDAEVLTPQPVNELTDTVNIGSQPVTSNTFVYIDATDTNTALADGSGNPWWAAGTSTSNFLWDYRTDYGLNDAGQFNAAGRDFYQAREDTCGQLVTTITGLTPGNQYRVDVVYHSKSSSENWNITVSFAPITTNASGTVTSGITYSWDGAVIYGVDTVAGVNTGNIQAGIYLMTGFVGNATADGSGQIKVYVDDITNEAGANQRTWYDGLLVENIVSDPYPAMFWDGLIDDVRIYSFAMDPQTVGLLYEDKSCYQLDPYDFDEDCQIDVDDLVLFCESWLNSEIEPGTSSCIANPELDLTGPEGQPDCKVDLYEFADIASQWLDCFLLPSSDCP